MNVALINPFLKAAANVLKTMALTEPKPGKPFLKQKNELSQGDVTGVVGLTGTVNGSFALSFSEPAILHVVSNMFGEPCQSINPEVEDAVGELSNMICGDARRLLQEAGYDFQGSIPVVISGKGHRICPAFPGPSIVMPFSISDGASFFVEVSIDDGQN